MTEIDFSRIRPLHGGQGEAFEELCCQLAYRDEDVPQGSVYHRFRGAGGDGGVECIWILPNGKKWGIQAKFFSHLDGKKGQLQDSFEQAIANHPELERYTFCFPIQLTGPTGARKSQAGNTRKRQMEKLEGWIEEFAASTGAPVSIDWWDATELRDKLLAADPHGGRTRYWFDGSVLTDSWFEGHLKEAAAQAGDRYTPELSLDVPAVTALRAFGKVPSWRAGLDERLRALRRETKDWASKLRRGASRSGVPEFPDEIRDEAQRLADVARDVEQHVAQSAGDHVIGEDMLGRLNDALDLASRCEQVAAEKLEAEHGEGVVDSQHFRQFMSEYQLSFPTAHVDAARELQMELRNLREWLQGPDGTLPSSSTLLIRGAAGVGKTHLIVDQALERQRGGRRSFLLFGEDFGDSDPWTTISGKFGFGSDTGRDELLSIMDAAAESSGALGVMFIDALNETPDRRRWRSRLPPMVKQIERYENLKLCVSCRDSYLADVLPNKLRLPEVEHNGFAGMEVEAVRSFFGYYGLDRPSVPLMQPEFAVPLFLHLVCDSLRTLGMKTLSPGAQGISSVIGMMLDAGNERVAEAIDYDPLEKRVQEAVRALVSLMAKRETRLLDWREAKECVEALYPSAKRSSSLFDQLARTNILTVLPGTSSDVDEPEPSVRFSFERVADHLLAARLLDEVHGDDLSTAFSEEGPLRFAIASDEDARSNRGLLEALAIQLPERFAVELTEVAEGLDRDEILLPVVLDALIWRDPASITPATQSLVGEGLAGSTAMHLRTMETLLGLSTRLEHPFNAGRLHRMLLPIPLADRDGFWCLFLKRSYEEERAVHRLIDWALKDDFEGLAEDSLRLWATALAWFCAAADRRVRDRATKALVRLFGAAPSIAHPLILSFSDVDDEYVIERVLCSAYGAMLLSDDNEIVGYAADAVWQGFFAQEGTAPLNALIRDHARLILEAASEIQMLPEHARAERFRLPYGSPWPIAFPTEEEVVLLEERKDLPALKLSEFGSDFAKYKVNPQVVRAFEQDREAVYRWFLREVVEMGYPGYNKNCARYDAEMLDRYGGGRARAGWADRIGKKYYWILLQRLVGQLSDHLPRRDFGDPVPVSSDPPLQAVDLRQLDPSDLRAYQPEVPDNLDEWYAGEAYDFDEGLTASDREWVSKFDSIDVTEFLESRDVRGEAWVPLGLEMEWEVNLSEDPDADYPRRVVQLQLDSVLVAQERFPELVRKLEEASFMTGPSNWSVMEYGGFFGEYPNGPAYRQRFETGELSFEDDVHGVPVYHTTIDLLREFEYDYSEGAKRHLVAPAPPLATGGRLRWDGRSGWRSPEGSTVVLDVRRGDGDKHALLVRKDWLSWFLKEQSLVLLWGSFQRKMALRAPITPGRIDQHEQYGILALANGEVSMVGVNYEQYPIEED